MLFQYIILLMHRFLVEGNISLGSVMIPDPALAHQVKHVLRMRAGDTITLFSSAPSREGQDFLVRIERLTERVLEGEVVSCMKNDREPRITLTLYAALLKKDNMEWVFEKGTEVGVSVFAPIVTERAVKVRIHKERAWHILKEAAEQSGRAIVPTLMDVVPFAEAVQAAKQSGGLTVFAHEKEARNQLGNLPLANQRINLFIGPEGGFSEKEVAEARTAGFSITALSRRVLRAETASITAAYFLLHRFGH